MLMLGGPNQTVLELLSSLWSSKSYYYFSMFGGGAGRSRADVVSGANESQAPANFPAGATPTVVGSP